MRMKRIKNIVLAIFLPLLFLQIGGVLHAQTQVGSVLDLWKVRENLSESYIQTAHIDLDIYAPSFISGNFYHPGDYVTHTDGYIYHCNSTTSSFYSGNTNWTKLWEAAKGWEPIGTESSPFKGVYDGAGYTVKNLYINRGANASANNVSPSGGENHIGLFGYVSNSNNADAEIKNLGIQNPRVTGRKATGALVGKASSNSKTQTVFISNCFAHGDIDSHVKGFGSTGGLVGEAINDHPKFGLIEIWECWTDVNISSTHPLNESDDNISYGGLVGFMKRSIAYDCFAYNHVVGGDQVGGIAGFLKNAGVTRCYFSGTVTQNISANNNSGIGAIVGDSSGNIPGAIDNTTGNNSAPNCYYPANNPPQVNPVDGQSPNNQGAGIDFTDPENFDEDWDFSDVWDFNDGLPVLGETPIQELPDYYYYTVEDGDWDAEIWYKTTNPGFVGGFASSAGPDPDKSLGIQIANQVDLNQDLVLDNLIIGASGGLSVGAASTLTITNGSGDADLVVEDEGSLNLQGSLNLGDDSTMEVKGKGKVSVDEDTGAINPGQNTNLIVNSDDFAFDNVGVDGFDSPHNAFMRFPPTNRFLRPFSASSSQTELLPHFINRKWHINGRALEQNTTKTITLFWNAADDEYYDWAANGATPVVYFGEMSQNIIDYDVESNFRSVTFNWGFETEADGAKAEFKIQLQSGDTLPVELSAFNAQSYQGRSIKLMWQTQSETNVQGFSFYRGRSDILEDALYLNVNIAGTNSSQPKSYIYYDREIFEPGIYYYWLLSTDFDGTSQIFGPINVHFDGSESGSGAVAPIPGFAGAFPNPFNPETTLRYGVIQKSFIEILIYNVRGQVVRKLMSEDKDAGWHQIRWDGLDDSGRILSSGVYFARMHMGDKLYQHKIVMMK